MKVYKIIIDRDGETTKEPGKVETEIIRTEEVFGSETVGEVFNVAIKRAAALDGELIAVMEICPSITILSR